VHHGVRKNFFLTPRRHKPHCTLLQYRTAFTDYWRLQATVYTYWYYFFFERQSIWITAPIKHAFNTTGLFMWPYPTCMLNKLLIKWTAGDDRMYSTVKLWTRNWQKIIVIVFQHSDTFFTELVKILLWKIDFIQLQKVFSVTAWFSFDCLTFVLTQARNSRPWVSGSLIKPNY